MGAGLAGSTTVDVNVNGNQGGGSKKQGLPGITNMRSSLVFSVNQRAYGTPDSRDKVFYINQLSRVGAKSTMFASTADGVMRTQETYIPLVEVMGWAIHSLIETYGDNYHVLLSGNSETLEGDLRDVDIELNGLGSSKKFFIKMIPGEPLYEQLSPDFRKAIDIANDYFVDSNRLWNQFSDEDFYVGSHLITLVEKNPENDQYLNILNQNGFGTTVMSHVSRYTGMRTPLLSVYKRDMLNYALTRNHSNNNNNQDTTDSNDDTNNSENTNQDTLDNVHTIMDEDFDYIGKMVITAGVVGLMFTGSIASTEDLGLTDPMTYISLYASQNNEGLGQAMNDLAVQAGGVPLTKQEIAAINVYGYGKSTYSSIKSVESGLLIGDVNEDKNIYNIFYDTSKNGWNPIEPAKDDSSIGQNGAKTVTNIIKVGKSFGW